MLVKLGINGFGRIGRVIFRAGLQKADLEIAAINDPAIDIEYICYLIKFDSTHGKFSGSVTHTKDEIIVNDNRIKVFHEKLPSNVPWQNADVHYVIEASGMFTSLEKASGHLASESVRRVIVAAPSVDVPMVILGVNDDKLSPGQKVISCASSTLYCLAPIVKVLDDGFGVCEGFVTSIHAMTPSLKPLDGLCLRGKVISCASSTLYCLAPIVKVHDDGFGVCEGFVTSIHAMTPSLKPLDGLCLRGKHWRDHRSICQNIIPATTGACKALAKIIPSVKDKLSGLAFRVPIANVSVLDLTIRLNSNTTKYEIIKNVEKASNAAMQNILRISNEEAVSSDFIGETHSCILDADSSLQLKPNFFKLVCWYENEYSYACRVLDSIFYLERQAKLNTLSRIANLKAKVYKKQDMIQQTDSCKKDVLCTTSQDTKLKFKQPSRLLMLKKPISSHYTGITTSLNSSAGSKKRNEIFKICKDVKEATKITPQQNRSSFFHSCAAATPPTREEIDCRKAHERLATLKLEFSKMVNITENLLQKSYIHKVDIKPETINVNKTEIKKSVNIMPEINVEEIKQSCDTFSEMYDNTKVSSRMLDMGGDHTSSIYSTDSNFMNTVEQLYKTEKYITQLHTGEPKINSFEFQNKLVTFGENSKYKFKPKNVSKTNIAVTPKTSDAVNRGHQDKILNIQDDSRKQSFNTNVNTKQTPTNDKLHCFLVETENNKDAENQVLKAQERETFTRKCGTETSDSGFFSLFKKTSTAELTQTEEPKDDVVAELPNHNQNIIICEEKILNECGTNATVKESQKDIISDDVTKSTADTPQVAKTITINDASQNLPNADISGDLSINQTSLNADSSRDLSKRSSDNLTRFFSPGHISTESEHTSKCGSHANTSMTVSNVEVYKHKQDIYDKLDSISATDSNNSFQINERKSQIINIADLTGSLEDLSRLDKICKIIEISDELSNKLFAALDNSGDIDIRKKKWSFKDLCEKLKLDDFCEQVFGKSSS